MAEIYFVLVTGAREWTDYDLIWSVLSDVNVGAEKGGMDLHVVCGAQRTEDEVERKSPLADDPPSYDFTGADWLAIEACMELQIPFHGYPAQWNLARSRYGKNWRREGVDRNARMLRLHQGQIREGHAFHDNLAVSKGTKDMVKRLEKAAIPTYLHSHHSGTVWLNEEC